MATTAKSLERDQNISAPGGIREIRRTLSNALIITRREVRDSFRDWRILGPIVTLTFLFPFLAQFFAGQVTGFVANYGAEVLGERTIPFLLMIVGFFPISISLVIALETFVGEKERRSLEPLLSTPLSNTELYIGKTLAAMIPPLVSSYGGMIVYLLSLLLGELAWRPPLMLIIQIILLTTVQALVMVGGAVVVSSQTNSTRAANLLASFIVIPMALVIQGESAIMFLAPDADAASGISALWAIIFGMLIVCILLLRVGNSLFNREELLSSTLDQINLRGFFVNLWNNFRAKDETATPARNLLEWYRFGVPVSLRRMKNSALVTLLVFSTALAAGYLLGQFEQYQLNLPAQTEFVDNPSVNAAADYLTFSLSAKGASFIFIQNGRVLLATLILSVFTFGVAALIIPPITFAILGYLLSQVFAAGYDPLFIMSAIFTHGWVEIPVIFIASAAAFHLGVVVTRPPKGTTVGHIWTVTLGDTLKLIIAVIIPGLILAALIEAFITPRVVLSFLGS